MRAPLVVILLLSWPAAGLGQGGAGHEVSIQGPATEDPAIVPDPRTGPRDRPRTAAGTARLGGRVVTIDTGRPLRGAIVRLQGGNPPEHRAATTDDDGRYAFDGLAAGSYALSVSKGSYVAADSETGTPFEAPRLVDVAAGQRVQNVDFRLLRGGVIAGRITDAGGEPVPDAGVRAMRIYWMDGQRILVPGGQSFTRSTDDLGQYRIFGLLPGDYYVSASILDREGGGMPESDVDLEGAVRTYFPGTPSLQEAQRVRVAPGQEVLSVNFALDPSRPMSISGTILDSTGRPPGGHAWVMAEHSLDFMGSNSGGEVHADGSFTIRNLSPGSYVLSVNVGEEERETAEVPVSLTSGDVTGLTVMTSPRAVISGQLLFETRPAQPVMPHQFQFQAAPRASGSIFQRARGHFTPKEDWTFEARASRGPVLIRPGFMPEPWVMKAVLQNGVDVTDSGIDLAGRQAVEGVQIVLSSRAASVSGRVTDERGRALSRYGGVIVFAEDASRWGPLSRYLHFGMPNQNGRFTAGPLPPGEYLAVALARVDSERLGDPEYLEALRGYATPFQVGEGQKRTLDLQLVDAR